MGNIKLGVSLIIQVNDTYTFRPVTSGNIKIYTDMGRQAISKGNGIFVFTNLSAGKYRMFIESDIFQDSYGEFEIIENNIETVHLWLIPDYKYDLLNNSAIVRGKSLMNNNERYIAYKPYNDFLVLADAYKAMYDGVEIEIQQTGSGAGITSTIEKACDIGMSSRALKDEEKAEGISETVIAMDGIAVIVNSANEVEDLTSEQIRQIFTGEVTEWDAVK